MQTPFISSCIMSPCKSSIAKILDLALILHLALQTPLATMITTPSLTASLCKN